MIAFMVFVILTLFLMKKVKDSIDPSLRSSFIKYSALLLFIGVFSVVIYTLDNLYLGQVDMEGDAQYYYEGALSLLHTGTTQTFYPNYEKFIASFLFVGNPLLARLAQLLVFLWIYMLSVLSLHWLKISKNGFNYFSVFTVFNGIYYGMLVVFVRDLLVLFSYFLAFFLIVWYYKHLSRPISYRVMFFVVFLIALFIDFLWLQSLGVWYVYPLLIGLVGEYLMGTSRRDKHLGIVLVLLGLSTVFMAYGGFELIQRLYHFQMVEDLRLKEQEDLLGIERTRSILDPFKILLGPGLIRPLLPSEYFIVFTSTHAGFYWWGTLFWYANLIISAPILLKRPLVFIKKRGAIYAMIIFLTLVVAYSLADISGTGMRKRAMFHFLYTLMIASTYFTPAREEEGKERWRLPLPIPLLRLSVILALMISTILSIKRVT